MGDSTSYNVALISGVLSAAFLMLHIATFSKLAEAGIITDTTMAEMAFVFNLFELIVVGVMFYGAVGVTSEILRLYEEAITGLSWQVRSGAYGAFLVLLTGSLLTSGVASQSGAAHSGALIRATLLVALFASMPFASLLMTREDVEHVAAKIQGVVA